MQHGSGFLAIYSRLKNKRSIVTKTRKTIGGGQPIRSTSISDEKIYTSTEKKERSKKIIFERECKRK